MKENFKGVKNFCNLKLKPNGPKLHLNLVKSYGNVGHERGNIMNLHERKIREGKISFRFFFLRKISW